MINLIVQGKSNNMDENKELYQRFMELKEQAFIINKEIRLLKPQIHAMMQGIQETSGTSKTVRIVPAHGNKILELKASMVKLPLSIGLIQDTLENYISAHGPITMETLSTFTAYLATEREKKKKNTMRLSYKKLPKNVSASVADETETDETDIEPIHI